MQNDHTWAVVLAAGDGRRLSVLTADAQGRHVPKQFCSLRDGTSLLGLALARARSIVSEDRVCVVVAKEHERWWRPLVQEMPDGNLIVQPRNRGTANGVLLALSYILRRDPLARLIFLPSDHHVLAEEPLNQAMASTLAGMSAESMEIYLLGIAPDAADPDLGYIIPQNALSQGAQGVRHFIEKPSRSVASKLIEQGGVWNSGIFAANGGSLMAVFSERFPGNVLGFNTTLARIADPLNPSRALNHLYDQLPDVDLSHHLLQFYVVDLRVVVVPHCGWSDLGTPHRVTERVNLLAGDRCRSGAPCGELAFLDLEEAVTRAARLGAGFSVAI